YTAKAGQMESGKVVLVTAAAGGTGQFAVQVLSQI
ncbi:zinc-binding alcohol dehydrogenase domain-containing protein, partial [Trifolium medium]|nr:zinc-binding alcohol dehydrogenase domain-containing protein [Trifolium medium]